ncbi:MAG: hypothetical protein O3B24_08865 [Verrucomicrobia bacterium]|nr:hypothetical protein [Verrucomicrobiota bacterium]
MATHPSQSLFLRADPTAPQNLASLRRLALNALKREKSRHSMRMKVKKAGWNNDYLLALLGIDPA